jgi:hypothetical protein
MIPTMRMLRLGAVLVLLVGMLVPGPALAKDRVRARLDAPVRWQTEPGQTLRVAWHLVDADGRRFRASGIYLRVSRCGARPMRVPARSRGGGYVARLRMPRAGISRLVVGLKGWRIIGERRERADVLFAFDPPLRRTCA